MTCKHCWHEQSSTTWGVCVEGYDSMLCCFCGAKALQHWEMRVDPTHGAFARQQVRHNLELELIKKDAVNGTD